MPTTINLYIFPLFKTMICTVFDKFPIRPRIIIDSLFNFLNKKTVQGTIDLKKQEGKWEKKKKEGHQNVFPGHNAMKQKRGKKIRSIKNIFEDQMTLPQYYYNSGGTKMKKE